MGKSKHQPGLYWHVITLVSTAMLVLNLSWPQEQKIFCEWSEVRGFTADGMLSSEICSEETESETNEWVLSPTCSPDNPLECTYDISNPERGLAPGCFHTWKWDSERKGWYDMGAYCFPAEGSAAKVLADAQPSFFADLRDAGYTLVFYQANLTGPPFIDTRTIDGTDADGDPRYHGMRINNGQADDFKNFLTVIDAIQRCFDDIEANGLKVIFTINYDTYTPPGNGDIDALALIGDDEGLVGQNHVDAFGEWLFNPRCKGTREEVEGNPECVYSSGDVEGKVNETVYVKRDFTHIHTMFVAGFIGTANGEWHDSQWPEDWETDFSADDAPSPTDGPATYTDDGVDPYGTGSEEKRGKLIDKILSWGHATGEDESPLPVDEQFDEDLSTSYETRHFVELRYPEIKNDYFDADDRIYYYWNDSKASPSTRFYPDYYSGDPEISPVPIAAQCNGMPNIDCPEMKLGHWNSGAFGSAALPYNYLFKHEGYETYYRRESEALPIFGVFAQQGFDAYGVSCTWMLHPTRAYENVDPSQACRNWGRVKTPGGNYTYYDDPPYAGGTKWPFTTYNLDRTAETLSSAEDPDQDGFEDIYDSEYECIDVMGYVESQWTDIDSVTELNMEGLWNYYRKFNPNDDDNPDNDGTKDVDLRGNECNDIPEDTVHKCCDDAVTNPYLDSSCQNVYGTQLICSPEPNSSGKRFCMDQAFCLPAQDGVHKWLQRYHMTSLLGFVEGNSPNLYIAKYLEDVPLRASEPPLEGDDVARSFPGSVEPGSDATAAPGEAPVQQSLFSTVYKRLGYRLVLNKIHFERVGRMFDIRATIRNTGYAAPFRHRPVYLVLSKDTVLEEPDDPARRNTDFLLETRWDLRTMLPSCPIDQLNNDGSCKVSTAQEGYKWHTLQLYLFGREFVGHKGCHYLGIWMPDPDPRLRNRPEYAIRLANSTLMWKDGVNWLNCSCAVRL